MGSGADSQCAKNPAGASGTIGFVGSQISGKKKAAQEKKTTAKTAKKTKKRLTDDDEKKSVEKKRKVNAEEQERRNVLLAQKTFRPSVSEHSKKVFEERAARKSLVRSLFLLSRRFSGAKRNTF